jgi:hypothetical protein
MNYESRLERLEQRVLRQDDSYNHAIVVFKDSDERPYDRIEYCETYGDRRAIVRCASSLCSRGRASRTRLIAAAQVPTTRARLGAPMPRGASAS